MTVLLKRPSPLAFSSFQGSPLKTFQGIWIEVNGNKISSGHVPIFFKIILLCLSRLFVCVCLFVGITMGNLMGYSWLCSQELFVVIQGNLWDAGIKPKWALCKVSVPATAMELLCYHSDYVFFCISLTIENARRKKINVESILKLFPNFASCLFHKWFAE